MIDFKYVGVNNLPQPAYQTTHSAAFDVCCDSKTEIESGEIQLIDTGLKITSASITDSTVIPFAEIRPRSGLTKKGIIAHLGTIDADYRGEIKVILENRTKQKITIEVGERIAQLLVSHSHRSSSVEVIEKERGDGGFGSTGV